MKTTLNLSDAIMRKVKREALRRGETMTAVVEAALRASLDEKPRPTRLPPIPTFHGGRPLVNLADRNALYDLLDPPHVRGGHKPAAVRRK